MYSQFLPTIITGEWRSGNAVVPLGPLTKMAISAGSGWLNRSRILPVESQLSYRHLRQRSVASRCRSAEVLRKDGGDKRRGVVSPVEAAACRAVARAKAGVSAATSTSKCRRHACRYSNRFAVERWALEV